SSGGTAKGVSQKVLANLNVSIPTDLVEQTAIGNYFHKLDALINQHQQQITKLNNIKQACLNKMFV
ncbi:restriction endonuclease subunit S, partial [Enterobacter roggenkampii]|uniref:restriction endonuclease subunit S n=1 Tax=Enterobacter roggenkampii TaxID=1812935 RepID=UPI00254EEA5D